MSNACNSFEKIHCNWHYCVTTGKCIYVRNVLHKSDGTYIPKRVKALNRLGHELKCVCCGSKRHLTFDHIIPLSKGGANTNENGQILCSNCNNAKGNKTISIDKLKNIIT